MAQNANAPGIGSVPDPGGLRYPTNSIMPTPALGGPAQAPAIQSPGAPSSAPGVPQGGVQRSGPTLPVNTPNGVPAPQLGGGSPAPAIQPVGGATGVPGVPSVPDPGGPRFAVGQSQAIGAPAQWFSAPGGGDPNATGGYVPGPTQAGAQWSQFNVSGNPNSGALSGGASGPAPTYLPGQTATNQVSPEANPNPGGL